MDETIDHLSKFNEIKIFDPRVKVKKGIINISPFYFNYSFVKNFIAIGLFLYILNKQNDSSLNYACILGIIVLIILIVSVLRFYNETYIDMAKKTIIIKPNKVFSFFTKERSVKFEEVKTTSAISNTNSTGYWGTNRRYYIVLLLKNGDEIKLVGSNKPETASLIAEKIAQIL